MYKHLLLYLLSFIFCLLSSSWSQTMWTKYPGNPVFSPAAVGTWNRHVFGPEVIFNEDSARFEMWYSGSFGTPWRPYQIGYATSQDGIWWTTLDTSVLKPNPGEWDQSSVEYASILRENGQYKMWYSGWNPSVPYSVGYATSPDGINWDKHDGNPILGPGTEPWEVGGNSYCDVLHIATEYMMWYTGFDAGGENWQIGYATSQDGINWTRDTLHNPVISPGSLGEWDDGNITVDEVIKIGNIYYLFYVSVKLGIYRIGLATSTNGYEWQKYDDSTTTNLPFAESDPVLIPSPGEWDGTYVESASVILKDDSLHLWYSGSRTPTITNLWRIGYATAPDCTSTGLFEIDDILVSDDHVLKQNYPNPFNPTTTIAFDLPKTGEVTLKIFNILGEEVAMLVSERLSTGSYSYEWNANNLASGVYLYKLQAGDYVETRKMVLMR